MPYEFADWERLNDRVMKKLKKSRRELFSEVEQSELKPLLKKRIVRTIVEEVVVDG